MYATCILNTMKQHYDIKKVILAFHLFRVYERLRIYSSRFSITFARAFSVRVEYNEASSEVFKLWPAEKIL